MVIVWDFSRTHAFIFETMERRRRAAVIQLLYYIGVTAVIRAKIDVVLITHHLRILQYILLSRVIMHFKRLVVFLL